MKLLKSMLVAACAIASFGSSAMARTVGYINYNNNPGTLSFWIPNQYVSAVAIDTWSCPGVNVDHVQVYSHQTLYPTERIDANSFSVNGGRGAVIFGLAVTTSGWGNCQLPVNVD